MNNGKFHDILNNFIGFKCMKRYIGTWKLSLNVFALTQFGGLKASVMAISIVFY